VCTLFYAITRRFFRLFDASVHTERTRVATITRLKSGSWRVQVRRKGKYVNETFLRRKDAEEWGIDIERRIDRQEPTTTRQSRDVQLFGDLIALHRQGLKEVGKDIGRSKTALPSWTNDLGIFGFQSSIASALSNSEKRERWKEPPRDGRHRSWIHQNDSVSRRCGARRRCVN
jgi:hypothetical protein